MVRYQCSVCKNIQDHDGRCDSCHLWDQQMQQLEDLKKLNRDLNITIYGDGGCCGCNESKRIKMFYALAVICIVIGLILMISGTSEDTKGTAGGLIGLGVIWGICGFCCPNGCCGEYKNNNQLLD